MKPFIILLCSMQWGLPLLFRAEVLEDLWQQRQNKNKAKNKENEKQKIQLPLLIRSKFLFHATTWTTV